MSKFKLISSRGEKLLNGENGVYLRKVAGLGATMSETFANVLTDYFVGVDSKLTQSAINGTLVYSGNDAAAKYAELMEFIIKSSDLKIGYQINDNGAYYTRRVKLRSISKNEFKDSNKLATDISFYCLEPWNTVETVTPVSARTYHITAGGQLPSALLITVTGATSAVKIKLEGVGSLELSAALTASDVLELCTTPNDAHVYKNGEDAIGSIILTVNPFFTVPTDGEYTLTVSDGTATVRAFNYWRSI